MSGAPPTEIIELAERIAAKSPCAKSKRGVVAYAEHPSFDGPRIVGHGFNGPPPPFKCDASPTCRATCSKFCIHAELRAIWAAWSYLEGDRKGHQVMLVHVKIDADEKVVPGGGPSCWQCSRHVLEHGLYGVWLYEGTPIRPESAAWRFYTAEAFHRFTLAAAELRAVAP